MILTKNYDTIQKTPPLNGWNTADRAKNPNQSIYRKLWNFDLLWKKLWYYGKNYGILVNYRFTLVNDSLL